MFNININEMSEKDDFPIEYNNTIQPGIAKITCYPKNRAWILYLGCCYFDINTIMSDLHKGICENKALLNDFQKYALFDENNKYNFDIDFLALGWEYETDINLRDKTLEECKKNWPGELY
jgi:hypothetical protein